MRVPLSWLGEYVAHGVDPADAEAVASLGRILDGLGLVVEGIERVGEGLDQLVAARVLELAPIEGADRIRRVLVDDGGPEPLEIVCGAWNFEEGDVVPLARVGIELPGGFLIGRRKMRGVTSNGMLCSGRELGLDDDAEGLLLLPKTTVPGTPLPAVLGIRPDVVFDLAIEPNRPDCLSIVGIARDLAARLHLPLTLPEPVLAETGPPVTDLATAEVDAPEACPQLLVRVLEQVAVVDSPPEIARRLELAGMRPINSVVDASNYVMLELGQPTHPYDLDRLGAPGLRVRLARPGEELETLDDVARHLGESPDGAPLEDCLICDAADTPVGIAGIMGGASSEIADTTTRVLLEVAAFDPLTIGRTSARQGLRTEASVRFWRGTDPLGLERAAARFCELLVAAQEAAGQPAPVIAVGRLHVTAGPFEPRVVQLRPARLNALLGTELDAAAITGLLAPIGFVVDPAGEGLAVTVPSFRPDATREVDLIEEVARHLGYEAIPGRERRSPSVGRLSEHQHLRRELRRLLAATGAHEAWTSPLVDPTGARAAGDEGGLLSLVNPIVPNESALRAQLLPGLLGALRHNAGHRNGEIRLFEVGDVFAPGPTGEPTEWEAIGLLLAGAGDDATVATAIWWSLAEALGLDRARLALGPLAEAGSRERAGAHPTRSAAILATGQLTAEAIGVVGEVDPAVLEAAEVGGRRVGWLSLRVGALDGLRRGDVLAQPVSRFPSSDIDLSFTLADEVGADRLSSTLREAAGPLLEHLDLRDVYRDDSLPAGHRSLTFRLRFCAPDRTLTDGEVAELRTACIAAAADQLGAELRG